MLFYTVGEVFTRHFPSYTPYALAQQLYARAWPTYLPAIQRQWVPYLDGKRTLTQASDALVRQVAGAHPSDGGP